MKRFGILALTWLVVALALVALSGLAQPASAQTMPPTSTADRLKPPPTVYPPNQADDGHQVYYQVCMACHGDRGQGLTEEWRAALDVGDQNCWQSGCHHTRRPPEGFIFPKIVPRVIGGGALARFETALDLHDYLVERMPYQNPGYLQAEEYWQLTAFLLRENSVALGEQPLSAENAAALRLRPSRPVETSAQTDIASLPADVARTGAGLWLYAALGALLAVGVGLLALARLRRK